MKDEKSHFESETTTMQSFISQEATKNPQPEVHIRVDKFSKYEIVAQTLADLQHRGLKKIGFVNNNDFFLQIRTRLRRKRVTNVYVPRISNVPTAENGRQLPVAVRAPSNANFRPVAVRGHRRLCGHKNARLRIRSNAGPLDRSPCAPHS
jgi:hypothetical protein